MHSTVPFSALGQARSRMSRRGEEAIRVFSEELEDLSALEPTFRNDGDVAVAESVVGW